jgi:hypothetical protein
VSVYYQLQHVYQKEGSVFSMGNWVGNEWRWSLSWRRNLFQWKVPIHKEFLDLIQQFVPSTRRENKDDGFSVKSFYLCSIENSG